MKIATDDSEENANGIAALAILKMLLEILQKKDLLSEEETDIMLNCAIAEIENEGTGEHIAQAKSLIENFLNPPGDEDTKTNI